MLSYVLQRTRPGIVNGMGKRFFSISFDIDTIAYGVHAALKAAVIMITIRVTFLSLRATISAILPVAFNELWKNVV